MRSQIIIFGASGDLTSRKLVPALFASFRDGAFSGPVQVIGASRRKKTDAEWRAALAEWIPADQREAFDAFAESIHYQATDGTDSASLTALSDRLDQLAGGQAAGRLFYLALAPRLFAPTVAQLSAAGLLEWADGDPSWRRVVVEKPFGNDLASARALNAELHRHLREEQILRIDHYLGKETVQNILALRFQNAIFEPLWNRQHVESVEISVCESVTMEGGRGAYYDGSGAMRDMLQNHVLQILALVAMEPPNSMAADDVRGEKVQVLRALSRFTPERVARDVVCGQYVQNEHGARAYLAEPGVPAESRTETFVALRANIHNWRWNGVPFLLRTGKALQKRYTDVTLRFRVPPVDLLGGTPADADVCVLRPNALTLSIQPTEGIQLQFMVKQPGSGQSMRPAALGFDYDDLFGEATPAAYQRLLLDAIEDNRTLFIRGDEVEAAWEFIDSIKAGIGPDTPRHPYPAGSWGPEAANTLFRGCEGIWGRGGPF